MNNISNFEEFKKRAKKEEIKRKLFGAVEKGTEFVRDNGPVIASVAAGVGGVVAGLNRLARHREVRETERIKECRIYDPRTGRYSYTKRPIKSSDWVKIRERYKKGEDYESILHDMRLTKNR